MKSVYRLKKNYQYDYVFKHSEFVSDKLFVLLYCKSKIKQTKVGFSISKKYGHAVMRNRLRRQAKAVFSEYMPSIVDGYNIVIIPRRHEPYIYSEIAESVGNLLEKAKLLK